MCVTLCVKFPGRVVLEQMRQRHRIGYVVHRDDFDVGVTQRRAKNIAADAAKSVDADLYRHGSSKMCWVTR